MKTNRLIYGIYVFCSLGFFLSQEAKAQKVWTLSDCIRHASEHNIDIKRQQKEIDRQNIRWHTARMSRLPDLNAGATQKLDYGRSLNRANTYEDINSQNSSFSLSTELLLFDGMKTGQEIAQRKLELKVHEADMERIKNQIALQIAVNYFQVLLNKEALSIAQEQIELSHELMKTTETLALHGKVPHSQVYDIQAQLANDELNATKARGALRLSIVDLIQLLELDGADTDSFDIQATQEDISAFFIRNPEEIFAVARQSMPEIKSAELSVKSREKAVGIANAGYYPSVSLAAGLTSYYYRYGNMDNDPFRLQMENNLQKTIYLTVRIPIFNRFGTRNAVRIARKDLEESQLIAEQTAKTLYKEIQKAYYDALSAQEKFSSTVKAVQANTEAMRYALEKYNAGKFTPYEYNEVKLKLANSLSEQAQAKYEWILQKILLDFYSGASIDSLLI